LGDRPNRGALPGGEGAHPDQEANVRKPDIRPLEERYGGQGHAGEDPHAGQRAAPHPDIPPDPSVEVPDASVEDLIQQPESDGGQTEDPAWPGAKARPDRRAPTERSEDASS